MMETKDLERLISLGHYAQARKRAEELLITSDSLRTKQLYAFSLSKSGQPEAAREFLERVAKDHPDDPETNGILGGIYKELFRNQQNSAFAVLARDTYDRSFTNTKNYYTGINAATMSTLAGQAKRGKELAQEVLGLLKDPEQDFWEAVTRAEALLLLKERSKSEDAYRKARRLAGSDWGKINSVYNQLWLLKHYLPVPREALNAFSPPVVAAFVGHMIDHPDRVNGRFPASIEGQIKQAITSALNTVNARIGFSSIANGGDILFAEALEELGGEVNLFLPFSQKDFLDASVSFAGGQWTERFQRLVNKYPVTYLTEEPHAGHADLFGLQTSILFGLSHLRSLATHGEPYLITVMSERDQQRKAGGTRDTVGLWPNPQRHININPDVYVPIAVMKEEPASTGVQSNRTDRPVLYFVAFDLSADDPTGENALNHLTNASLPPAVTWRSGQEMVAGFRQLLGAMEFVSHVLTTASPVHPAPRVTLHVGPFPLHRVAGIEHYPRTEEGGTEKSPIAVLEQLTDIHHFTPSGSVYASGALAALLALDNTRYKLSFIDTLREIDKRPIHPIDVFSVALLHLSKLVNH